MTILEALQSLTTYPVPENQLEKICVDRGLTSSTTYTQLIAQSEEFQLASADVYFWMYGAPSIGEQDIQVSVMERSNYRDMANAIYSQWSDPKYSGIEYGFIGEDV